MDRRSLNFPQVHPRNGPGSFPQKKLWECAGKLDGRLAGNGFWELTRDSSREHAAEPFPGTLQTVCPESCPATHSGNHASGLQGVPSKNHI